MSDLVRVASLFAHMTPKERQEVLGALGLPERPRSEPQEPEPAEVTPFSALVSTPSRRRRKPITLKTVNGSREPGSLQHGG